MSCSAMIEDHFGMYLCMTEILAKECKSGKSTVSALGTVEKCLRPLLVHGRHGNAEMHMHSERPLLAL